MFYSGNPSRIEIIRDFAEKPPFRPIAAIWAILEHLYSEMAAEPPFQRGPLHKLILSRLHILLHMIEQLFSPA
jgi:hypothetical protein